MPKPYPRHGLTWDVFCTANVISHIWSYMGVLISVPIPCSRHGLTGDLSSRFQRHVPNMVLCVTFHNFNNANVMSQTWSYMGSHSLNVMTFVSDTFLMFQRDFLT
ncbi:hypothetical protein Gotur_032406, partial [Gossypium turneri]